MSDAPARSLAAPDRRWRLAAVVVGGFLWSVALLPFVSFRHDDWWLLANVVRHLGDDWSWTLGSTMLQGDQEVVFFFRPLAKLAFLLLFRIFGLTPWAWAAALIALALAGVWFAAATVRIVTARDDAEWQCWLLGAGCLHLHFFSLAWLAASVQHAPGLLLLAFSAWTVARLPLSRPGVRRALWLTGGLVAFVISLGFKESSVAHALFIALLLFHEPSLRQVPLWQRLGWLTPYGVLTGAYLWIRLALLPLPPGYMPVWDPWTTARAVALMGGGLFVPWLALALATADLRTAARRVLELMSAGWPYWAFLGLFAVPHLFHPFVSPSWLSVPGLYSAMAAILSANRVRGSTSVRPFRLVTAVVLLSLLPLVAVVLHSGWWRWHEPERQIQEIVSAVPDGQVRELVIEDCTDPLKPLTALGRVVGRPFHVQELWRVFHEQPVRVRYAPCGSLGPAGANAAGELRLRYEFPTFRDESP